MSESLCLLQRFRAATGYGFVEKHYPDFPLDAKILNDAGQIVAVADVLTRRHSMSEHAHFMHAIFRIDEGVLASESGKVPYLIICAFSGADAVYQFSPTHVFDRQNGEGKNPREQKVIMSSLFIPINLFVPFKGFEIEPIVFAPPVRKDAWLAPDVIEEDFDGS